MVALIVLIACGLSLGLSFAIVIPWQYRSHRSMLEVSIPARFAVKAIRKDCRGEDIGFGSMNMAGTVYRVRLSLDQNNVYLLPRSSIDAHMGSPTYRIPRIEIVGVAQNSDTATIKVADKNIKVERFVGLELDQVLGSPNAHIDSEKFRVKVDSLGLQGSSHLSRVFIPLQLGGAVVLLLACAAAVTNRRWPLAFGFLVGGVLTLGLLGQMIAKSLDSVRPSTDDIRDLRRLSTCSNLEFLVLGLLTTLPMALIGILLVLTLGRHNSFLMFLAGAGLAFAFSMMVLFIGLRLLGRRLVQ